MMNWLIINTLNQSETSREVVSFLYSFEVNVVHFEFNDNEDDLCDLLKNITHIIVLFDEDKYYQSLIQYVSGFVMAKDIPYYIVGTQNYSVPWYFKSAIICDVFESLQKEISNNFDNFLMIEQQQNAQNDLFSQGLPLTSDSFSSNVSKGNLELADLYIKAGLSCDTRNTDGTPIICIAARYEQKDMISFLISKGANIDAISTDRGYSAVMDAVWKNCFEITKILVEAGANLNFISRDGQTALILAVGTANEQICELLSQNGADIHMKDNMGMSALEYARLFKKDKLVSLFTESKG